MKYDFDTRVDRKNRGNLKELMFTPDAVRKIVTYLSFSNAHRQRNTELVKTFARFVKNPQKLVLQSKARKKVPLNVLRGTFIRRLTDLLLRLDVSLTAQAAD